MTAGRLPSQFWLTLVVSLILLCAGEAINRPVKLHVDLSRPEPQRTVSVTCRLDPNLTSMQTVNELRIYGSKPGSKKNDMHILASIDRWDPTPMLFGSFSTDTAHLTGSFGFDNETSELALSRTLPDSQESGYRYRCAAEGTDHNGQAVRIYELAEITETEPSLQQVCHATNLDALMSKLDQVADSSTDIEARLANTEGHLENVETTLNDSVKNTDNKYLKHLLEATEEKIESRFQALTSGFLGFQDKVDDLVKSSIGIDARAASVERRLEDVQNTSKISLEKARSVEIRLQDLEATALENRRLVESMTGVLHGLQQTMGGLQQALTIQASGNTGIKDLVTRLRHPVSGLFRGKQYVVSKTREKFNIDAADAVCRAMGGYLAEIDDEQEYDFVFKFLKNIGSSVEYALGAGDTNNEGVFTYHRSQKVVTYTRWVKGEPNNFGDREDCCTISVARGGMNDLPCDDAVKYVCEVQF